MAKSDQRRASNRAYDAKRRHSTHRKLYQGSRWKRTRLAKLAETPLCELCQRQGVMRAASVVNHRIPHRGDETLFWDTSNLEALCPPCHDIIVQRMEVRGYAENVDADGWPVDPMHPANRTDRPAERRERAVYGHDREVKRDPAPPSISIASSRATGAHPTRAISRFEESGGSSVKKQGRGA